MQNITPENIIKRITKISGYNPYENTRKREYVEVRALACYLMREKLNMRWTNITKIFEDNGKAMHHASAIHLVKNFKYYKLANPSLQYWENMFHFIDGLDYEEIDKINVLENRICNLQNKYDTLKEQLNHPVVKLVYDIPSDENKWELADKIVLIKKAWKWKEKEFIDKCEIIEAGEGISGSTF